MENPMNVSLTPLGQLRRYMFESLVGMELFSIRIAGKINTHINEREMITLGFILERIEFNMSLTAFMGNY
ncbi:hypothetical protein [Cuniculiplasma divulgatum]|uniref:hypothetical protein n=1 Tax=Cuniculiplasma divulgatum TaxID=1673428 RepID=UPI0011AEA96C|nr:hypothetical protein [Cuniculiplasma divulgatum]